jgi:DNA-3-methyladenine glycosylase
VTTRGRAPRVLPRSFYARPTLEVVRELIGKVLVHRAPEGLAAGVIVETEAYIGEDDPACHAAAGPTPRNQPLYGPPGRAYVYLSYGMHVLVNAVTERDGFPAAVLIRALDPIEGLPIMRTRRGRRRDGSDIPDHALCRGPGNLTRAMGITLQHNRVRLDGGGVRIDRSGGGLDCAADAGVRLEGSLLYIEDRSVAIAHVVWTPRIGISAGTDRLWRCRGADHPAVSGG